MMDNVVRTGPDASKQGMDATGSIPSPAVNGEPAFSGVRSEVGSLPSESSAVDGRLNAPSDSVGVSSDKIFRAVKYGHSCALLVPASMIPVHQKRDDVVAVTIARASEQTREFVLYTTHLPGYRAAYLDLFQLGAKYQGEFRILAVRLYSEEEFPREYNVAKPKGLENTELVWKGQFAMRVDGAEIPLREAKFRTYQGMVVLDAEVTGARAIKIQKKIDSFEVRLKDHSPVTSLTRLGPRFRLAYQRTGHDTYPHIMFLNVFVEGTSAPEAVGHSVRLEKDGLTAESPLTLNSGMINIRVSVQNGRLAWEYWASAETEGERMFHQGDIGERVVEILLEKAGFKIVEKEQLDLTREGIRHDSERQGPDIIVEKEGRFDVVYVKHWLDSREALREAKTEVRKFQHDRRRTTLLEPRLGKGISGGLAVQVSWSYSTLEGVIYAEYIEYP